MLRRQADKEKRYTNGGAETGTFLCGRTRTSKKGKCSKSGKNPDLSGHRSDCRPADVPLGKARTSACGHGVPRRRSAHRPVLPRRAEHSVHRLQFSGAGGGLSVITQTRSASSRSPSATSSASRSSKLWVSRPSPSAFCRRSSRLLWSISPHRFASHQSCPPFAALCHHPRRHRRGYGPGGYAHGCAPV